MALSKMFHLPSNFANREIDVDEKHIFSQQQLQRLEIIINLIW